jgi:hypothetical protein
MAEVSAAEMTADACCAAEEQARCCEPSAKVDCCGEGDSCGCDASVTRPSSALGRLASYWAPIPLAIERREKRRRTTSRP